MAQVTLYLDEETAANLDRAAREEGISRSRWVAGIVQQRLRDRWPASVERLAGAWSDIPTAEELRSSLPEDTPRESF